MQNISLLISLSQRWLLLSFLCIFSENKLYVKYGSIYLLLTEKNHYRHLYTLQFFTPNHDIQIYLIHCDGCILFHCMDGTLFKHHCTDSLIFYSFCFTVVMQKTSLCISMFLWLYPLDQNGYLASNGIWPENKSLKIFFFL